MISNRKTLQKLAALILAIVMVAGLFPMPAAAAVLEMDKPEIQVSDAADITAPQDPLFDLIETPTPAWLWHDSFEANRPEYVRNNTANFTPVPWAGPGGGTGALRAYYSRGHVANNMRVAFTPQDELFVRFFARNAPDWNTARLTDTPWEYRLAGDPAALQGGYHQFFRLNQAPALSMSSWRRGSVVLGNHLSTVGIANANANAGNLHLRPFAAENVGEWSLLEFRFVRNSDGPDTGVFEYWVNGELAHSSSNNNFVDQFRDFEFVIAAAGWSDIGENNHFGIPAGRVINRYYSNLVISTEPIGAPQQVPVVFADMAAFAAALDLIVTNRGDINNLQFVLNEADYHPVTWAPYRAVVISAVELEAYGLANNIRQSQVDDALAAIATAQAALQPVTWVYKGPLTELITSLFGPLRDVPLVETRYTGARIYRDYFIYTQSSWDAFLAAVEAAIGVEAYADATQAQVDHAIASIEAAMDARVLVSVLRIIVGSHLVDDPRSIPTGTLPFSRDESLYSVASWQRFTDAVYAGRAVLFNENATAQAVHDALVEISDARNWLEILWEDLGARVIEQPTADWLFWDDFTDNLLYSYFERPDPSWYATRPGGSRHFRNAGVGLGGSYGIEQFFRPGDVSASSFRVGFGAGNGPYYRPQGAIDEYLQEAYFRWYFRYQDGWLPEICRGQADCRNPNCGDPGYVHHNESRHGAAKMGRITNLHSGWRQTFVAHVWADFNTLSLDPTSGVNIREAGDRMVTMRYNDFNNFTWTGNRGEPMHVMTPDYHGVWYSVEVRVKLNDPGVNNGVFEMWLDADSRTCPPTVSITNKNWVGSTILGPDGYFGINAFFLEYYWNNGSPAYQRRYFDNLVISRAPIGPAIFLHGEEDTRIEGIVGLPNAEVNLSTRTIDAFVLNGTGTVDLTAIPVGSNVERVTYWATGVEPALRYVGSPQTFRHEVRNSLPTNRIHDYTAFPVADDSTTTIWMQVFSYDGYRSIYQLNIEAGVVPPEFGWNIFNNGPGGAPSRPNSGLAANSTIRMWAQFDGVNAPVYFDAADTIVALDQDGGCAMEFVRVNRMWVAGTGWINYFNLVDVNKNGQWQYINLYITVYGQTVHVLLVNALFEAAPVVPKIINITPNPAAVEQGGVVELVVTTQGMPDGAWVDLNVAWRDGLSIVGGPRFYIVDNQATIVVAAAADARLGRDGFAVAARTEGDWGSVVLVDSKPVIIQVI